MPSVIQREFGGFPFLDNGFLPGRVLAAAAMCRWSIAHPDGRTPDSDALAALLDPAEAKRIRARHHTLDLPYGTLGLQQKKQIEETRSRIAELIPEWQPLIRLPMEFLELQHSQAISSSNFAWPQHVFLAKRAFTSGEVLAEQILHETSHQWLYLLEEMFALQTGAAVRFTLPSGTADRSATELLGAAHVVVNLRKLWLRLPVSEPQRQARLHHLAGYGSGCADLLDTATGVLTSEGQILAARLIEEIRKP